MFVGGHDMVCTILMCCALFGSNGDDDKKVTDTRWTDLADYQTARSKVGRDADAHVRLALWCEAHGLTAERIKHLSLAVLYDPSHALARGLLGVVAYHGKWDRPDVVGRQIQHDPARQAIIREYLDRRVRAPDTADAQLKLAAWCDEQGLLPQAQAHYSAVTRIDPSRESAWKHLGYKKQGSHWVKPEEVAVARQKAAQQKQADKQWKTTLERLRDGLESKDTTKRTKAEQGLAQVTDPRAVPMIWAIFVRGGEQQQIAAVQLLGQIDGPSASNGLAALAVFSRAALVRQRAIETVTRRDPRDVIGRLIGLIRKPYKYQVRHVNGPGRPDELFVDGERFNIQRFYENRTSAPALDQGRIFTPDVPFDPFSVRNIAMATMIGYTTNPGSLSFTTIGKPGYSITFPFPFSPRSAAEAGKAMAANPQNASTILGDLVNNPANRLGPSNFSFPVTSPRSSVSTQHADATVKPLASDSANQQFGTAMDEVFFAQQQAAQRDLAIALELEEMRQANQDLEQRLAMDIQFIEATNDGINLCNDRTRPVLKAITGQDLGIEPEKWKRWWTDQLGYAYQTDLPATKPTYSDFVTADRFVGAYKHAACFAAGTLVQTIDGAQAIDSIRVGDCVLSQQTSTGLLAFQPVVATHHNHPAPTLRIVIRGESIVATGIHRFWKAGKGWTMARELNPGDRLRMVGGTVKIEAIETDKIQPVYNLDVAGDRDFFVGAKGLLVHDFSFVQPVFEPFDRHPDIGSHVLISN
jgi:tetratricopeptide (TPR) repeat protein